MKTQDYISSADRLKEAALQIRAHINMAKRIQIAKLDKIFKN